MAPPVDRPDPDKIPSVDGKGVHIDGLEILRAYNLD
jgi:hypothetical protein